MTSSLPLLCPCVPTPSLLPVLMSKQTVSWLKLVQLKPSHLLWGRWQATFHLGGSLELCGPEWVPRKDRQSWQERWEYIRLNLAQLKLLWNCILMFLFTTTFLSLLQLFSIPWSVLCKAFVQLQQFPVAWKKHRLDYVPSAGEDATLWGHCL